MITMRTAHIREYTKIAGIRLDETRLTAIKSLMQKEYQAKLDNMRKRSDIEEALHLQISRLPPESINMIFNAMELGLSIQEAYDGIKAEHYNKTNSASMVAMSRISFLPSSTSSTDHPNRSFPVSNLKSSITPSSTASVESRLAIHPDHRNLQGLSLSLPDMKQLLEEVQHNKLIGHVTWGKVPSGKKAKKLCAQIESAIIENNKAYQRYPSDFVFGILSKHAYEDATVGEKVIFKDEELQKYNQYVTQWTIHSVHALPELGKYYGAVYKNKHTRQLVLAHRGTPPALAPVLKKESALKEDIRGVIGGEIVKQHYAAYEVTKEAAEYAKNNNYHFSITGHSLGAWLAEISVYFSAFEFKTSAKAVTFDSPGSIIMNIFNPNIINHENKRNIKDLDITTYLSDPNFINTCNQHVGRVYRLHPDYEKLHKQKAWAKILEGVGQFSGVKLEGLWSVSGHALAPLLATFDPKSGKPYEAKVNLMSRWPDIKYTPRGPVSNLVNYVLATRIPVLQQPLIKKFLDWGVNLTLEKTLYQTTIDNVVNLLIDIPLAIMENRIDLSQYLTCWEILSKSKISQEEKLSLKDKFSLTYKGSYETIPIDPLTEQLISRYKGGADWYLKKLHDCLPEKIMQYLGHDSLITKQLITLKEQYRLGLDQGRYQLIANSTPIDPIKEHLLRLLEVTDSKVAEFLQMHEKRSLNLPSLRLVSSLPQSLGEQYILRVSDIEQISKILSKNPYAIIHGEPGFGKTTLATEYGHRQKSLPESVTVIKVDADSQEKIDAEYRRMALISGINAEKQDADMVRRLVNNKMSGQQEKVLLIFDNVEEYKHIKPYLDYLPANAKMLITTRHHRLIEGKPVIEVKPFSRIEATQYIKNSDIKDRISGEKTEVEDLVEYYVQFTNNSIIPYYLSTAIAIIKADPLGGITDYLKIIKTHPYDEGEIILQQRLMEKSAHAWEMLQYAAFLDPDAIDIEIFTQLFKVDKLVLNEAIKALESLSAMYIIRKNGQPFLLLHRLTQKIVRRFIDSLEPRVKCMNKKDILLNLAQSLNTLTPITRNNPSSDWQQAKKLMPHVKIILKEPLLSTNEILISELWTKRGRYTTEILGLHHKSLKYHKKALLLRQQLYPNQPHSDVAESLDSLGCSYEELGGEENSKYGLTLKESALTMRQTLYQDKDQGHPELAQSLNNVGLSYEKLGGIENRKKGLMLLEQALAMREILHENKPHPDVARSLNNVGCVYEKLGGVRNREKSLALKEQALSMRKMLYPNQPYPNVATSLNSVGRSYYILGGIDNKRKGIKFKELALEMQEEFHANQPHPHIAGSLNSVGCSYINLGEIEKSIEGLKLLKKALEMLKKLYADRLHPDIAKILNNIGCAYIKREDVKNIKKGLSKLKIALEMRKALYPDQPHPDVAQSLNDTGCAHVNLGEIDEGLKLLQQSLDMRQILYSNEVYFDVAQSLNNVGLTYEKLGGKENCQKGVVLQEQALAMWQVLYPDQSYPDVTSLLHNLSSIVNR